MNNRYMFLEMRGYNDIISFMTVSSDKCNHIREEGYTKIVGVLPAYGDYPNMLILEKEEE